VFIILYWIICLAQRNAICPLTSVYYYNCGYFTFFKANSFLMSSRKYKKITTVFRIIGWGTCLVSLVAFLSEYAWIFELISHFRVQYAIILFLLAFVLLISRMYKLGIVFIFFALLNVYQFADYLPIYHQDQAHTTDNTYKLLAANVYYQAEDKSRLFKLIADEDPDFVLLSEVEEVWAKELEVLKPNYPYSQIYLHGRAAWGLAMFSRIKPSVSIQTHLVGSFKLPFIEFSGKLSGTPFRLYSAHIHSPEHPDSLRRRTEEQQDIVNIVTNRHEPSVLAGD